MNRPSPNAARLRAFGQWLTAKQGLSDVTVLRHTAIMRRLLGRPIPLVGQHVRDNEALKWWTVFCAIYMLDETEDCRAFTPWHSRLVEATMALCDLTEPTPEQRVLRLMARGGLNPHKTLRLTAEALQYWDGIDPLVQAEVAAIVAQLPPRRSLAGWISAGDRADGNGGAQSKLRRTWTAWCEAHELYGATLTDLAESLKG